MMKVELLQVKYHDRLVGTLSLTPDNKLCAFEYAPSWLAKGFSISPLARDTLGGHNSSLARSSCIHPTLRLSCEATAICLSAFILS